MLLFETQALDSYSDVKSERKVRTHSLDYIETNVAGNARRPQGQSCEQ